MAEAGRRLRPLPGREGRGLSWGCSVLSEAVL